VKIYLQAAAVTLVAGALFVGGFLYWKEKSFPQEAERRVLSLEQMEKSGIPSFEAKTLNGESIRLDAYKGKIVVLNFWASWCGPCVEEFPSLLKLAEEMKGNLVLVAVSGDSSEEDIHEFMKQLKDWDRPWVKIVWDHDRKLTQMFEVDRLPESYIAGTRLQLVKKITGSINWYTPDSIQYMQEVLKK
jgi:thiol-disulfide isomerase/thioredoxin